MHTGVASIHDPTSWTNIAGYHPLAESLEWLVGGQFWHDRGGQAFVGTEQVPYLINNNSNPSLQAAEVLFASLFRAEACGQLPQDLFVLELGPGTGLFARFFLDWFRHLCQRDGKDWDQRLCYLAVDRSPRMLRDALRQGIFADHPGRYRLLTADASTSLGAIAHDPEIQRASPRPFQAVFLNYVLDCLPPAVCKIEGDQLSQLMVRATLAPGSSQRREADIRRLAASSNPQDRAELAALFPTMLSEYRFLPCTLADIPLADFALPILREHPGKPVLLNYGAISALDTLLNLVTDGAPILINDYGSVDKMTCEGFEHQNFARSASVGLNFPLLARYFANREGLAWVAPEEKDAPIFSRMLCRNPHESVVARFKECFDIGVRTWQDAPAEEARQLTRHGRYQHALGAYREALTRQPLNWALMLEVSRLLTHGLRDARAGVEMARAAARLNPGCSPEVWNAMGEALVGQGRHDEAFYAYRRALRISPDDVHARYNLACLHVQRQEHASALPLIGEALARDRQGMFRDALLQKQAEALSLLSQEAQQRALALANRIIGSYSPVAQDGSPARADTSPGARFPWRPQPHNPGGASQP